MLGGRVSAMGVSMLEWVSRFAAELGTEPPSHEELEELLAIAGVAAHASERTAAPVSCWLAARSGSSPEQARAVAERLSESLGEAEDP